MTEFLLSYKNRIHEEDYSLLEEFVDHCLQGIKQNKMLVLVGEPKSGKSTLIKDIMRRYKDQDDITYFPFSPNFNLCSDITIYKLVYFDDEIKTNDRPLLEELLSINEENSFKGNLISTSQKTLEGDIFLNIRMHKPDSELNCP
jgi:tRNA A37 threonylcarbamoyladenosine biosynthesis protein TsaE